MANAVHVVEVVGIDTTCQGKVKFTEQILLFMSVQIARISHLVVN